MILRDIYQWEDIKLTSDDIHFDTTLANFVKDNELNDNIEIRELNHVLKGHDFKPIFYNNKILTSLIEADGVKSIIYDVRHHSRIDIFFKNSVRILLKDFNNIIGDFTHITSMIYNTELQDFDLCIDDEFNIGGIYNLECIALIFSRNKLLYERRF